MLSIVSRDCQAPSSLSVWGKIRDWSVLRSVYWWRF